MKRGFKYIEHASGVIQRVRIRRRTNRPDWLAAHGPGSINCESEVLALAARQRFTEAAAMADRHDYENPHSKLRRVTPWVRAQWREYAKEYAPL